MTREESIEILEEVKVLDDSIYQYNTKYLKALDMAIKALEQQPNEDCISRQAVLSYIYNDLGLGDEENGADIERQGELEKSYEYIKSLPPITPLSKGHRWIPVSEGLPEEREWMGTKRFGTTISDEVYVTFETPYGERFTKHLSLQNGRLSKTDQDRMKVCFNGAVPIAWMPLPTPYRPQKSEVQDADSN